jgi:hypothetical protein
VPEQIVPLWSRRRENAALLQKLQHVVPAAALVVQGARRLAREPHAWSFTLGAPSSSSARS